MPRLFEKRNADGSWSKVTFEDLHAGDVFRFRDDEGRYEVHKCLDQPVSLDGTVPSVRAQRLFDEE